MLSGLLKPHNHPSLIPLISESQPFPAYSLLSFRECSKYKQEKEPNKKYKDLKQKQKAKIADWMFEKTCDYYREHNRMPEGGECEALAKEVFQKIQSLAIWVPYEEVYRQYLLKLPRYEIRIAENGIPEKAEKKKEDADKPKVKQKGRSKKVCPNCGRKMKQQFIGLQHCKCGMSWKKDIGYFERTGDMVFALERRKVGKKTKQCPVIRYR